MGEMRKRARHLVQYFCQWSFGNTVIFSKSQNDSSSKFWIFCNLSMLLLLVLLQTLEQYNNLLKTKAFTSSDSVFLSKRCLILLICFNLNRQLETLLIICSLQLRFASSWTPRSLATVSVDICLLKSFSLNSGSVRSSCGTPNIRTLVLLGLIRGEFLQHHWHIFLRSSFKAEMATIESAGGKERYNLQSST